MTDGGDARPRRWAPEWIAVLTLAVAIVALGGGLFTALNAMEERLRADMGAMDVRHREEMSAMRKDMGGMEARIREDVREVRRDVGTLRESTARIAERVSQLDRRVLRLETRFDEYLSGWGEDRPSRLPDASAERTAAGHPPPEAGG